MGRTFRHTPPKFESDRTSERAGRHPKHMVGRKLGGMKTINDYEDDEDDSMTDFMVFEQLSEDLREQ